MKSSKKKKKSYGKTNRVMGHNAERLYAKEFRDLGYKHCITSRQGSRVHDDSGIDLVFIPFNVQIKAGKQRGLNPVVELKSMEAKIKLNFPEDNPVHTYPNLVILRKAVGQGIKRTKYDEVVVLPFKDFKRFIKKEE